MAPTDNSGGRAQQRRVRTRARLKEAGLRVFLKQGVHAAGIADITAAADVGVGTFYLHFKSKDELYATLMEDGLASILDELSQIAESLPPARQLPVLVHALFRGAANAREVASLAIREPGHDRLGRSLESVLNERLAVLLETAREHEPVAEGSSELLARQLTGLLMRSVWWWFNQDEMSPEELAEQVLRLLRHGLPAGVIRDDEGERTP